MKDNDLLIRLDERTADIQKDIKEIKDIVFGNGKEGLCYIVQRHEDKFKNLKYGISLGFIIITTIILVMNYFKI